MGAGLLPLHPDARSMLALGRHWLRLCCSCLHTTAAVRIHTGDQTSLNSHTYGMVLGL